MPRTRNTETYCTYTHIRPLVGSCLFTISQKLSFVWVHTGYKIVQPRFSRWSDLSASTASADGSTDNLLHIQLTNRVSFLSYFRLPITAMLLQAAFQTASSQLQHLASSLSYAGVHVCRKDRAKPATIKLLQMISPCSLTKLIIHYL